MTRYDPYSGAPLPKKRTRAFSVFLCLVLLAALAAGAAVAVRGWSQLRIVPGRSEPVYRAALDEGSRALPGGELTAPEIFELLAPACVGVTTDVNVTNVFGQVSSRPISGSGFLISEDGYILTNHHVIETAAEKGLTVRVMLRSGEEYAADIVGSDAAGDVALLKTAAEGLPFVRLGSFEETQVGDAVYAVGNPLGELTYTMTAGIVSARERSVPISSGVSVDMFQIDAAINSGNSGGPVVNSRGQVVGIASAKYASYGVEGLGFAIPIDDALRAVDDLSVYGYVRGRAVLGVTVANAAYYGKGSGALVDSVSPGSCSERAGLRKGDVIVEAGGTEIAGTADLLAAKKTWRAGDTVTLVVLRGGERLSLRVTLDEEHP